MTRRHALGIALSLSIIVLGGATCDTQNLPRIQDRVLNRIGFGPDPWSRARIQEIGVLHYIDEQLEPSQLDDSALEAEIAALYPVTTMSYGTSRATYHSRPDGGEIGPFIPLRDATAARVLRAAKSKKQLEQALVDFWYNHFNVEALVDEARFGFVTLERDAIRPHVFGKFEDMLRAVAQNPGMLSYLDNRLNFRDYTTPQDRFAYLGTTRGINENFAREILELHTLGVGNGYTQQDIREVARAFTGWTIPEVVSLDSNGFEFIAEGHDTGPKSLFGGALVLPAGRGLEDGIDVIDWLAAQPQTAERISRKLVQRFVSETAPQAVIEAASRTYLATDGDLREVMRTILRSPQFLWLEYENDKVKRPLHFVASLARAVGVADDATFASVMDPYLQRMGEGLYRAGPPTGYPESSGSWTGEGGYLQRMKLAYQAAHGEAGFTGDWSEITGATPTAIVDQLIARLARNGIEASTRQRLIELATSEPPAQRVGVVAATLLASPDFLVH
jgi:hypothetical protein